MDEDTTSTDVSDDNIADVSLLDLPDQVATDSEESSDTADNAKDDGADTKTGEENDSKNSDAEDTAADSEESSEQQQDQATQQPTKAERDQAAARAFQDRQRARNEVAQTLDQTYGPKTADELVEDGMKPEQAQVEALRQEMAYKDQRNAISELNATLRTDATEVMSDMPIFREFNPDGSKNADYDPNFTKMVEDQYKVASRLETDDNGIILNAELPLYDYYKKMYDIYQTGTSRGEQRGQQNAQAVLSRTENPGGSSSTNGNQSDDLEAMEERLGNVVIT